MPCDYQSAKYYAGSRLESQREWQVEALKGYEMGAAYPLVPRNSRTGMRANHVVGKRKAGYAFLFRS
jgi:hypothetical protein